MSQFFVNSSGSGGSGVTSITGNSGTPASGAVTLETQNATPQFVSSASAITLNFGLTNLVLGSSATNITSATENAGFGDGTFSALTSGIGNTALGYAAGFSLTTGSSNVLIGTGTGQNLTVSISNTAVGQGALGSFTSGPGVTGQNVAIGLDALGSLLTGVSNTALGTSAGGAYIGAESSNICIGSGGVGGESNVIRIGTPGSLAAEQNVCFIAGINGVTVTSPTGLVNINANGQLGTTSSSSFVSSVTAGANINLTGTATAPIVNLDTQILQPNGTVGAPPYSFTNSPNSGMYSDGSQAIISWQGNIDMKFGFTVECGAIFELESGMSMSVTDVTSTPFAASNQQVVLRAHTSVSALTIQLPSAPRFGQWFIIKDVSGLAATNPITYTTSGGTITFDGATSGTINTNYGALSFMWNGSNYDILF